MTGPMQRSLGLLLILLIVWSPSTAAASSPNPQPQTGSEVASPWCDWFPQLCP